MKIPKGLSRNVISLGIVSGLTDVSSEMLYPVVPLFLTTVLGAPMSVVGIIEGTAEATVNLVRAFVGRWSDRASRRKPFVVLGYGLSAVSKPLLALAGPWGVVLLSRVVDRLGKGVRTPPRDALLAASCDAEHRGKAFGLHRAMDTAGAALGPLAAILLLEVFKTGYRTLFLLAFIPAAFGVWALAAYVDEREAPERPPAAAGVPLSAGFKRFLCVYLLFALGNSSDVFLLLKAKHVGLSATRVILAYVLYNVVYALAAAPAGMLSDRIGRRKTLAAGLFVFAGVYLGFAFARTQTAVWPLFAAYGFYGAFTEGIAAAAVADLSAPQNRGFSMGLFQACVGGAAFVASISAGLLWTHVSPAAPFVLGAVCACLAALPLASRGELQLESCREGG